MEQDKPKFSPLQPENSPTAKSTNEPIKVERSDRDRMLEAVSFFGGTFDFLADEPDIYSEHDGVSISSIGEEPAVSLIFEDI